MKRILHLFLLTCLLVGLLCPCTVVAASKYGKTYTTSGTPCEKPEDIFENPYCFYKGTGEYEGIEVWAEKKQTVNLPMDGVFARDVLFINKSANYVSMYDQFGAKVSGIFAKYTEGQLVIFHPNPLNVKMEPGESTRCIMTVDFANNIHNLRSNINGELLIEQPLNVTILNDGIYKQLNPISIKISTNVKAYSRTYLNKKGNRTATVNGYVKDASGKAVSGAEVTVSTAFADPVSTKTNSKGYYSVKVFGSYNEYYGTWHQAQITVSKKGFADQSTIIRPKTKKSITKSFKLVKKSKALSYKKTKEVDIGIQSNYFDVSENKQMIATTPFHSALQKEKIEKYANLSIFNLKGTVTKNIRLYAETACVAVTEDGKYVATQRAGRDDSHSVTVIYDKNGKKVYEREGYPPVGKLFSGGARVGEDQVYGLYRSAVFSKDNQYLVVSSMDGDVYCLDWRKDEIIWTNNVRNQVRTSEYSKDGSLIYLSSGDGYLYALSALDGSIVWKTYIGSWATCFTVGEKYLALSTKSACHSLRLLDAKTGKQYWSYDTPGRGEAILSPDEKMVFYCNDTASAYNFATSVVLDTKTGKVLYSVGHGSQMGAWSKNGKYLVVKGRMELYVCKASSGEILWKKQCSDCFDCGSRALAVSNDGKYIAAGFNSERGIGKIVFYKKK